MSLARLTIARMNRSVINRITSKVGQSPGEQIDISNEVFRIIRAANKAMTNGTSRTT
jgi:hypothetical protein